MAYLKGRLTICKAFSGPEVANEDFIAQNTSYESSNTNVNPFCN